ncbi:hypothetical protein EA756_07200 [Acinetobacter lactucae]|uniref:Uncharacterized protein n=1 Tax=Acinetobacter lactucae TaxID=1785128 RepID=A0A429K2M2_9GAMM|nr:hypothetical protein [Acinetobacter lactucae]RSO58282.1 hypothetical protein EA756_07200 [Acinetobacter lactucae]
MGFARGFCSRTLIWLGLSLGRYSFMNIGAIIKKFKDI